jgi:Metallo-peptidase family M12/S-layer homology domain
MRRSPRTLVLLLVFSATASIRAASIPSPYRPTASPATAARLAAEGQEALDFDVRAHAALRDGAAKVVEIDAFPIAPGETARLRLSRFEVAAPDAKMTLRGKDGETTQPLPRIQHFRGTVEGEPESSVYVGVSSDMVVAWVHSSRGHAYVGPDEAKSGYVVRTADSPLNAAATAAPWNCAQESLPQHLALSAPSSASPAAATPEVAGFRQAMVDVETDNQLYLFFGSDQNALTTYVLTLYGADDVIYDRDVAMHLTVQDIHIWTVPDPYSGGDTGTQLLQLGDWWHVNKPLASNPRTLVHYLSGHPVTGGVGWVGVLCIADFPTGPSGTDWGGAYSLTQVFGTYPLQLWDQDATSHEMGHNTGSIHTHCMGPPAYPDWTDECYNAESGCYAGPVTCPSPGAGTIMSYCHLPPCGWQYVSLQFHPRCINDFMLPEINGASCLASPATFTDVPTTNPFFHWVETVYRIGVTGGCNTSPLMYCPNNSVTRQQMAVFLMKSEHGSGYTPPACSSDPFPDVSCSSPFATWIQQLVAEGITSGCGGGNYCPTAPVTRQQMAAFLLKTQHGSGYTPPACSSDPFPDVPCSSPFAIWIQQLVTESITGGCAGGNYCPTNPVTRAQMAVFLTKTFDLGW